MNPIQAHPASGLVAPHGNYAPEVDKTGAGTYVTPENESHNGAPGNEVLEQDAQTKGRWFQYVKTKQFWITLLLGQGMSIESSSARRISDYVLGAAANRKLVLAICITSTNTLSTLLANEGTSIPAFQSFFNYVLLNIIYTSYTIYKYGFKKWGRLILKDGWRFFILAFLDVEGNYFVVLAYRYVSSQYTSDSSKSTQRRQREKQEKN
jgi:solute carrier family 35 protein F1/2